MFRTPRNSARTTRLSSVRHVHCHQCGYNLHAQPRHGACPECGASVEIANEVHHDRQARVEDRRGNIIELIWMTMLCGAALFFAIGTIHAARLGSTSSIVVTYVIPCLVSFAYYFARLHRWETRLANFVMSVALLAALLIQTQLWNLLFPGS